MLNMHLRNYVSKILIKLIINWIFIAKTIKIKVKRTGGKTKCVISEVGTRVQSIECWKNKTDNKDEKSIVILLLEYVKVSVGSLVWKV